MSDKSPPKAFTEFSHQFPQLAEAWDGVRPDRERLPPILDEELQAAGAS